MKVDMNRKKVAVLFGGVSPEHDVSVLTGVQAYYALDQALFDAIPVYIDGQNRWWTGEGLIEHHASLVNGVNLKGVKQVYLTSDGLFCSNKLVAVVDVCLLALHGSDGENGTIQGICEINQVPYTGMRRTGAAVAMNKWLTKRALSDLGVKVLPDHLLRRLPNNQFYTLEMLNALDIDFPVCVKPCSLGSSIGVGFADDVEMLQALVLKLFEFDDAVLIEPAVQHLKEFNVSVCKDENGDIQFSAIESPKTNAWLDFEKKYCQGAGSKKESAHGLINLSRDIEPEMPKAMRDELFSAAKIAFEALGDSGAPRIDFIADMAQKKIWFNEINAIPGSFGYYLWSAKNQSHGYVWLLNHLLHEAQKWSARTYDSDPVPEVARLFKRHTP